MPSSTADDDSGSVDERLVCSGCVGEKYLSREVKRTGEKGKCHYCVEEGRCWSIAQLSDRIDKAFEQHFERTPENPEGVEAAMMGDKDCSYEWHRKGEESLYAIASAASISEEIAEDVREVLSDRHYDRSSAEVGDEQEFDADAHYGEKRSTGDEYWHTWQEFEKCLREESRYFAPIVRSTLDRIFVGVAKHKTMSGRTVVVDAGPGKKLDHLFRARVFYSDQAVIEAIERPDLHLGPPPAKYARPGRMNAAGISVFYGARSLEVALAEVRPPVGSRVVCGRFSVTRPLKLLNLGSLREVVVRGSLFDPTFADRSERGAFLSTLCDQLSQAVMPDDETAGYLVTQVVADYLANVVKLDGILFPSVQAGAESANAVLFHDASRVQALDLPKGSKVRGSVGYSTEDGYERDYTVREEVPAAPVAERPGHGIKVLGMGQFEVWGSPEDPDSRSITLQLVPESVQVEDITKAEYRRHSFSVSRHRTTLPEPGTAPPF